MASVLIIPRRIKVMLRPILILSIVMPFGEELPSVDLDCLDLFLFNWAAMK
jgi:hypothetical protein